MSLVSDSAYLVATAGVKVGTPERYSVWRLVRVCNDSSVLVSTKVLVSESTRRLVRFSKPTTVPCRLHSIVRQCTSSNTHTHRCAYLLHTLRSRCVRLLKPPDCKMADSAAEVSLTQ